jgi:UDP-N-acetylmuramoyl-tripeptide--D-alanyl-D-alanine ligase
VVIDSRTAGRGDLFIALPGENRDGHAFVSHAIERGAVAAVVSEGWAETARPGAGALVVVQDPAIALMDLARDERSALGATVIGITGSTGKTCTKDFTAAVLGGRRRVVASRASFNNEVGLPLTILEATPSTEFLVCEMGSRGRGHIRRLCEVARPSIGIVTNVGVAHMELFGSSDALREAKAELVEALPGDGVAVLNADDDVVRAYAARTPARVVLFGMGPDAEVRAANVKVSRQTGAAEFDLETAAGTAHVRLRARGEQMVPDALAAAAVGSALGIALDDIADGLARASVAAGRMEAFETADGLRVVNDAYNANPTSMAAALRAARWMAGDARCVAVLGPMAELGPIAGREHERVGELLARIGIDALVAVGPEAGLIAVGAEREGVEPDRIVRCEDTAQAVNAVRALAGPGDVVLVKASRVARLERVAEALRDGPVAVRGVEG